MGDHRGYGVTPYMHFALLSVPCQLHKALHKLPIDAFLNIYSAGGKTYLPLVGKAGTYHDGEAFLQVHVIKHYASIFASKLWGALGGGGGGTREGVGVRGKRGVGICGS